MDIFRQERQQAASAWAKRIEKHVSDSSLSMTWLKKRVQAYDRCTAKPPKAIKHQELPEELHVLFSIRGKSH